MTAATRMAAAVTFRLLTKTPMRRREAVKTTKGMTAKAYAKESHASEG